MTGPRTNFDAALARHRIGTTAEPMEQLAQRIVDRISPAGLAAQIDVIIDCDGAVYCGVECDNAIGVAIARNPSWFVGTYTIAASTERIHRELALHLARRADRDELPPCVGTRMRDTAQDLLRDPEARA